MRLGVRVFVASALFLAATATPYAQVVSISSDVVKDWVAQKALMMTIAAEMPDDKFTYKSTPAQRNYGEHAGQPETVVTEAVVPLDLVGPPGYTELP